MRRNGRVWINEHNRRVAQLDAAQYWMLLVRFHNSEEHSIPSTEFLSSLGTSCRAQRMANLEYYVHWSRHSLTCISQATRAEALVGACAVTYNPHFTSFLSPFECAQSLGCIVAMARCTGFISSRLLSFISPGTAPPAGFYARTRNLNFATTGRGQRGARLF